MCANIGMARHHILLDGPTVHPTKCHPQGIGKTEWRGVAILGDPMGGDLRRSLSPLSTLKNASRKLGD